MVFGGLSVFLLERAVLRRAYFTKSYLALGLLGGYALGAYSVQNDRLELTPRDKKVFDKDIVNAFERKYLNTVLNATGFGNNSVNVRDYADTHHLKKPY